MGSAGRQHRHRPLGEGEGIRGAGDGKTVAFTTAYSSRAASRRHENNLRRIGSNIFEHTLACIRLLRARFFSELSSIL